MLYHPSTEQRLKAESFGLKHLTGLVTLLFTDMVDSTALKQREGRQSYEFFEKHHQLVRECLGRFPSAQEIETAGDSFFLIFAVPSDAVEFALILQSRLRGLFQATGVTVQDRIGVNLGEVVIREADPEHEKRGLFGIQVDTCARVMSLAKGGQVLMTRQVFDSARQALKGEEIEGLNRLSWVSHGYYQLKGVEEPAEVCEVAESSACIFQQSCSCLRLFTHRIASAVPFAFARAGRSMPARIAMIAITTSSSIKVKPLPRQVPTWNLKRA